MGYFASSVFNGLFSWLRTLFSWLWDVLLNGGKGGVLAWLAENWKTAALILLLAGTVIDLTVYVFRWRPDIVWASYFRRKRGEGVEVSPEAPLRDAEEAAGRWLYADGSSVPARRGPEELPQPTEEELQHLHYEEPVEEEEHDTVPVTPEEEGAFAEEAPKRKVGLLRRMGRSILRDLRDEQVDDDLRVRYRRLKMPEQSQEAYQRPVYPQGWEEPRDDA